MRDDLAVFLHARLDEDAATARYAGPALVAWLTLRDDAGRLLYTTVAATSGEVDDVWCADGKALPEAASTRVVYDPARALREVEAKRAIVLRCEQQARKEHDNAMEEDRTWVLWPVLFDLAAVYCDHPDYRPEWKP